MIPSNIIQLDEIPLTSNGKVDRKKLLTIKEEMKISCKYEPPSNEIESELVDIWQQVLEVDKIGIKDNFFDLGGDSIKAIEIYSKLQINFDISINKIFEAQTIKELAKNIVIKEDNFETKIGNLKNQYLFNKDKDSSFDEVINNLYFSYLKKINQKYASLDLRETKSYSKVFLTGATGYLGSYLLKDLLNNTQADIYTIVRGNDAEKRLENILGFYFENHFYSNYNNRIHVLNGDLEEKNFGLPDQVYKNLVNSIESVFHSAAKVNHFGKYKDFHKINVQIVENLLEFCKQGKQKELFHMSTTQVMSGDIKGKEQVLYTEYELNLKQEFANYYAKSKFEAEKRLIKARENGMNINVFRIGTIVFDSKNGNFQKNIDKNAFYLIMQAFIRLGILPDLDMKLIDFSFVDYTSKAVVLLATRKNLKNETYHIYNPNKQSAVNFYQLLKKSGLEKDLDLMDFEEFADSLFDNYGNDDLKKYVDNLIIHSSGYMSIDGTTSIKVSDKTEMLLEKLKFKWPEPNLDHIKKMLDYCKKNKFI